MKEVGYRPLSESNGQWIGLRIIENGVLRSDLCGMSASVSS